MHPRNAHVPAAAIVAAVPVAFFLFNPSSALAQCAPGAPSGLTVTGDRMHTVTNSNFIGA
jgi:hypothetical protein